MQTIKKGLWTTKASGARLVGDGIEKFSIEMLGHYSAKTAQRRLRHNLHDSSIIVSEVEAQHKTYIMSAQDFMDNAKVLDV